MVCHRRAGKTVSCVADLVGDAKFTKKQDARFAYVCPQYGQAKDVAWLYVRRLTCDIPGVKFNESELRADLPNGARVRLYGADNPDSIRGLYLDGCILDEFADMKPSLWGSVIRPMLMDRKGWAAFIGTFKGRSNEFFRIVEASKSNPDWFHLTLKASESGILPAEELEDARLEMTPEQYAQEMECSPDAAIMGAYWGKEIAALELAGHITSVPYDPELPVHTAWDLGIGASSMAIWFFQVVADEVRVIDYYENHGQGFPHYASVIAAKDYRRGDDWVPHDSRVPEMGTGRTRLETMIALGFKPRVVPNHRVADGINAVRVTLPKIWFDKYRCADGIEALRQYQSEYDDKARLFRDTPKKDWTSHPADAMRYLCMGYREIAPEKPKPKPRQIKTQFTMDEFTKAIERRTSD